MTDVEPASPRAKAHARRDQIVAAVEHRSRVDVAELGTELGVPAATLRRDLRVLEAQGRVRRSYGTILAVRGGRSESALATRAQEVRPEQLRIASAAVGEIGTAQVLYLDEGHHTALIGRALPHSRRLTIVTPSLPLALELARENVHEVLIVGGRVRPRTFGSVEHWAQEMLAELTIDLAFIGANGVSPRHGLTTPDPMVAAVKRAAVAASTRRVFVGDHTKFGASTFVRFARVSEMDVFITDSHLSLRLERELREAGASVRLV
ncbi:MAG: DeoR/GlpR family DNA-binding transcription regulator [Cellulomonadaceae bacterium]